MSELVPTLVEGRLPRVVGAGLARVPGGRPHTHARLEVHNLTIITAGRGPWSLGGRRFTIEPGYAYLAAPGDGTNGMCERASSPLISHWISWRCDGGNAGCPLPWRIRLDARILREALAAIEAARERFVEAAPGWEITCAGHLLAALGALRRQTGCPRSNPPPSRAIGSVEDRRLRIAVEHLSRHRHAAVAIEAVAAAAACGEPALRALFRRRLGCTPRAYLIQLRLHDARRLLAHEPDTSLDDIAHRCAFADAKHLKRHFRRSYGQTPAAFRQALRLWRS
jgi:AraC-like DNA-binding protein